MMNRSPGKPTKMSSSETPTALPTTNAAVMPSSPMLIGRSVPMAKIAASTSIDVTSWFIRASPLLDQCLSDELHRVTRRAPGPVRDLLAARAARGGDQRLRGLLPDRREQAHPADAHTQLIVLGLKAERAGHATAAGVELDHLGTRDALQQRDRRRRPRERLLVAVA